VITVGNSIAKIGADGEATVGRPSLFTQADGLTVNEVVSPGAGMVLVRGMVGVFQFRGARRQCLALSASN